MPHRLHLLLVEDPGFDDGRIRQFLEAPDVGAVRLDRVEQVEDARLMIQRHHYDAALIDLGDHASDRIIAVRKLCEEFPHLAVVVLTQMVDQRYAFELLAAGAQEALAKSALDAESIARSLRNAVERQRLMGAHRQQVEDGHTLFREHPYAWLICDAHTLRISDANEAALVQYGYSRAALVAMSLLKLSPDADHAGLLTVLRSLGPSTSVAHEITQTRRDGQARRMALRIQNIVLSGRPVLMVLARDITIEARAIHSLEHSELRFRKLFQYSLGLICTHDLKGVLLSVNPAAAKALGFTTADLLGRPFIELMPERQHAGFADYLRRIILTREDTGSFRLVGADGRSRIWEYHNVLDEDDTGEAYVLGHAQDVTDRVRQERHLQEQALRDPLTGCFNRRALGLAEHQVGEGTWAVAVIDLDGFKAINDTLGHARGDQVLSEMGQFLRNATGEQAMVIRTGGDEFLVVVPGGVEAKLIEQIERGRKVSPASFSVGWAARSSKETLAETMRRADEHLYAERRARAENSNARAG